MVLFLKMHNFAIPLLQNLSEEQFLLWFFVFHYTLHRQLECSDSILSTYVPLLLFQYDLFVCFASNV